MADSPRHEAGKRFPGAWRVWLVLMCLAVGCRSGHGVPSTALAAVQITSDTGETIRNAALQVFTEHGFLARVSPGQELIFEKRGSPKDDLIHGTWFDEGVWIRIRARVRFSGPGRYILEGDAFMVEERGALYREEEKRLRHSQRGTLQRLFEKVKSRVERE